jgi:LPS-assembly lipoprotein
MWWSEPPRTTRRAAVLGALAVLAGCGFVPVHGPGGALGRLVGTVTVEAPASDAGFVLRNRLVDRFGPAAEARYLLSVDLVIRGAAVAVTTEQETTRFNLPGEADYTLTEVASGRILAKGLVTSFSSYSATGTAVSTFAGRDAAEERLAIALADQILLRLAAQVS